MPGGDHGEGVPTLLVQVMKWLFPIVCVLGLCLSANAIDLFQGDGEIKGLHLQMQYHGMAVELKGDEAEKHGNIVEIRGVQVSFSQLNGEKPERYMLESPYCRCLSTLQELKSDASVSILGENGFRATGVGYDVFFERKVIRVRSAVRVVLPSQRMRDILRRREQNDDGKVQWNKESAPKENAQ